MTNTEHIILAVCFGMNIGWLSGSLGIIIADGIRTLKEKNKAKKEQKTNEENEMNGGRL